LKDGDNVQEEQNALRKTGKRVSDDSRWACEGCHATLGYVDKTGKILRVKYRDLYITVEGGTTTVVCRVCGRHARLEYIEDGETKQT